MSKINPLTDVAVISTSANTINTNMDEIVAAFDNTLSRDGSTPNQMEADIDLNGNNLLNVNEIDAELLRINGTDITTNLTSAAALAAAAAASAAAAAVSADDAATSAAEAEAATINLMDFSEGAWVISTAYERGDMVESNGSSYLAKSDHTSSADDEPGVGINSGQFWQLLVERGASGMGSGDVLAANAGSEYTGVAGTFRNNISAMLRAITKRSGLDLATNTTIDSSIYNSDGTNTNGPSGNVDGDSFVSSKIDTTTYNFIWFGNTKAWLGRRVADVNSWVQILTANHLAGTGSFVASLVADPVAGDANKVAQFDANGNIAPGFSVLDEDDMASNSAVNVPSQQSVKAYVDSQVGASRVWQNMLGSRSANTSYQNTTGRDIDVSIVAFSSTIRQVQVSTDNLSWVDVGRIGGSYTTNTFTVPDDHYYRINGTVSAIASWAELR